MDVTRMTFKALEFDIVFDKGTLDCLSCAPNADSLIEKYISSVRDILKPKGVFICISHGQPENRLKSFFNYKEFQVDTITIEKIKRQN